MNNEEIKNKIREFVKSHQLTVISTVDVDNNKPESAVIGFAEKENLDLVFGTSNKSRKYKNLQKNKNVSFVIGWSHDIGTVQYEGVAHELSGVEASENAEFIVNKNTVTKKFLAREDQRYFLVKPTWIRLLDKSKHPDEIHEVSF
jgi:general stress protein 26